ncbi:DUF6049 family protein [Winkia neuii]|uniref:DUF6049 family protein n=1 Tax=Winkia neuii subsp. anitrata TaxID=29318 RepID=A0AB38XS42_9ACTO|nr:DUF6049 family protein [Winkia neuii]WCE47138.1 DUF6049 family protein [Winkia neuii subsp. anitrata]
MRKQILLCALAVALFVCSLPPLAHAEDAPTVTITALTSTLNPQTKQVKAHLEVHNPTAKPLTGLNANIDVSNASTLDANELCDWLHGAEDNQKWTAVWSGAVPTVPAHGKVGVDATFESDSIPALTEQWGPRGITATVGQASDRSILLVGAPFQVEHTKLLLQVPVRGLRDEVRAATGSASIGKTAIGPASGLAKTEQAEGEYLSTGVTVADTPSIKKLQVLAKEARPGVVYLIDPAVIDSGSPIVRGKTVGLDQPTKAPIPSASALAALKAITKKGGKILLTPWGFPQARPTGATRELSLIADKRTTETARALAKRGVQTTSNFAAFSQAPAISQLEEVPEDWPIIAPQKAAETTSNLSYTPSARTTLYAQGNHPTILNSQVLSRILSASASGSVTEFDLSQLALSAVAIMDHERPFDPRIISAELPANANAAQVKRARALYTSAWTDPITLDEALSESARADEFLPVDSNASQGLSATKTISHVSTTTDLLSLVGKDPERITYALQSQLLLAAGNTLPQNLRSRALRNLDADSRALRSAIAAQPSSTINLISTEAMLPVRISNGLAIPVNVQARARTSDPRLQVGKPQNVQVPARSAATANIPLKAVGNGNIQVRVGIATNTGQVISQANPLHIRVRPGLEDKAIWGAAAIAVAVFVFGLIRTFRRGRKMPVEELP